MSEPTTERCARICSYSREGHRLYAIGHPFEPPADKDPVGLLDLDGLRRLETAASILVSVVNVSMPERSPYGCPHSRDWLNGLLDDVRAALGGSSDD